MGTGAGGVTQYVPNPPDSPITELAPDTYYGKRSEQELFASILQRDSQPGPGQRTGSYLNPPSCGYGYRTDPALGRAQVRCWHSGGDLTFDSGARGWSITNLSHWWCPRGMDVVTGGMCFNSEAGYKKIYSLPQQSCPGGPMPCVPATGAKELHEQDFTWGKWTFTRHYTSLSGLPYEPLVGNHWTHDFEARILPPLLGHSASKRVVVDERQNFDVFTNVDATWMRSQNVTGRRLHRTGSATVPFKMFRAGREEWFDANGNLAHIELPDSPADSIDLTYCDSANFDAGHCSGQGLLWLVADRRGRSIEFVYSAPTYSGVAANLVYIPRRLIGIRSGSQWLVQYGHDSLGRLTHVLYPGGAERRYHYHEAANLCRDSAGQSLSPCPLETMEDLLTGITDESGTRLSNYRYDNKARFSSSEWAGGAFPEKLEYPSATTRKLTYPSGLVDTITYSKYLNFMKPMSTQDQLGRSTSFVYDSLGRKTSYTNKRGSQTRFEYSGERESAVIEAYGEPEQRRIESDWDLASDLVIERRTKSAAGAVIQRQTFAHNARRQPTVRSQIDPATGATRTTTTHYCETADVAASGSTCPILGLVKSIDGPRTDVADITTFRYYASTDESGCATGGECRRKGDLWQVVNALGHATTYLRYDREGRVRRVRDPNNVVTDMEYNARGWLLAQKVRGPNGSVETDDAITRYEYDALGQVVAVTGPDGDRMEYEYDAAHRLVAIENARGDRIEYTLDAAGNRTAERTKDAAGVVKRSLSRTFDALGRLDHLLDAYNRVTDHDYGNAEEWDSVRDALSHTTRNELDPLGRLKKTIQDYNGLNVTTQYQYDALDQLVAVTDPKQLVTQYSYDALGNLKQLSSPDTGVATYENDAAGNRTRATDARGVVTNYTYDALGRITSVSYPNAPDRSQAFSYDAAGADCLLDQYGIGRLHVATYGAGSTEYCYDRFGRVTQEIVRFGEGFTLTTLYQYTLGGRVRSTTYSSGLEVEYGRDVAGNVRSVQVTRFGEYPQMVVSDVNRLPFGPIGAIHYGTGRVQLRNHDANYGIDAISTPNGFALDYTLDEVGRVSRAERSGSGNRFSYDALGRLTGVTSLAGLPVQSFAYDETGNRLSKRVGSATPQNYSYRATSHRLDSVAGTPRTYDATGNTVAVGSSQSFVYDASNRLVSASSNGASAQYVYNARGERISKIPGPGIATTPGEQPVARHFAYDSQGHLLGEYTTTPSSCECVPSPFEECNAAVAPGCGVESTAGMSSGSAAELEPGSPQVTVLPKAEYVWLEDMPVAVVTDTGEVFHVEADHLGSPRAVVDPNRNLTVWNWEFLNAPFGDTTPLQDPDGDGLEVEFNLRFPGQYFDAESNLHYNYFRDYEPGTGRYVESDPIGLDGGISSYSYVAGAPLGATDRMGLDPLMDCAVGGYCDNPQLPFESLDPGPGDAYCGVACEQMNQYIEVLLAMAGAGSAVGNVSNAGKALRLCKGLRCKRPEIHNPHHYFRMLGRNACHLQMNCWVSGLKGVRFDIHVPYPCDGPSIPGVRDRRGRKGGP